MAVAQKISRGVDEERNEAFKKVKNFFTTRRKRNLPMKNIRSQLQDIR